MPLYDFRCPSCGLQYEVSRPMSRSAEPAPCPQCKTNGLRLFTAPPIVRAGSSESGEKAEAGALAGADFDDDFGHSHGPGTHTH